MLNILIIICGSIGIIIGKYLLGRWYNHLSIYSFIWTLVVVFYNLKLILYYPICEEAWFFIISAWFVFYIGSATIVLSFKKKKKNVQISQIISNKNVVNNKIFYNKKNLKNVVIILSSIAFLSIILQLIYLFNMFEWNITQIIRNANKIYHLRVAHEIPQFLPYLSSFALAACSFAGIYTAIQSKINIIGTLPLIIVSLGGFSSMARARILIAFIIFFTSFLLSPRKKISKKDIFLILSVIILTILILIFISSVRGITAKYEQESIIMEKLRKYIPFGPALYFYLSGPPVVLSEYINEGRGNVYPGSKTFAPFFNILSKLNLFKHSSYRKFYYTPQRMNTGTYLLDLYSDFGVFGILFFPYLLGIICTFFYLINNINPKIFYIVLLAHLYVIIYMSFIGITTRLGYWLISILIALISNAIFKCRYNTII